MLVAQFKHVITYYQKFCDESCQPWSECALYRILNDLNPWQRKSLAGLDNTTAYGLNGFKSLENVIINFLGWKKNITYSTGALKLCTLRIVWSIQIAHHTAFHLLCQIPNILTWPKIDTVLMDIKALVRIALTCTNWLMKLPLLLMV